MSMDKRLLIPTDDAVAILMSKVNDTGLDEDHVRAAFHAFLERVVDRIVEEPDWYATSGLSPFRSDWEKCLDDAQAAAELRYDLAAAASAPANRLTGGRP
jgi:hypothetical protein